jgi:hypothetical protein
VSAATDAGVPSRATFRQQLADVPEAIRGIRPSLIVGTAILCLLSALPHITGLLAGKFTVLDFARGFMLSLATASFQLLCIALADHATDRGAPRLRTYAGAVLAAALVGALIVWLDVLATEAPGSGPANGVPTTSAKLLRLHPMMGYHLMVSRFMEWIVLGGLATFVYADRRDGRRLDARLHAAQLERAGEARRLLESQLQAMQARIEPQFLFDTLGRIGQLYVIDRTLGDRMLDDLIAYLRVAMPQMRDTSSTLARELELAGAYVSLVSLQRDGSLDFSIKPPAEIAGARFPPLVLLPLIDLVLARGVEHRPARLSIRGTGTVSGRRLSVVVTDKGDGFAPELAGSGIVDIRQRLEALYGDEARIVLRRNEDASSEAVVEIPSEMPRASASAMQDAPPPAPARLFPEARAEVARPGQGPL